MLERDELTQFESFNENGEQQKEIKYMSTKKIAYYQSYDPSVLEMPEYCVKQDMRDDIASLEDS